MTTTAMQIDPEKLKEFEALSLAHGGHRTREDGMCAMEAAAWLAGENHSDNPDCVCPLIAACMRRLNDRMSNGRRNALIKPMVPMVLNTRGSDALMIRRGWLVVDFIFRTYLPLVLKSFGEVGLSGELKDMTPLTGNGSLSKAEPVIAHARARLTHAPALDLALDLALAIAHAHAHTNAPVHAHALAHALAHAPAPALAAKVELEAVRLVERMAAEKDDETKQSA